MKHSVERENVENTSPYIWENIHKNGPIDHVLFLFLSNMETLLREIQKYQGLTTALPKSVQLLPIIRFTSSFP